MQQKEMEQSVVQVQPLVAENDAKPDATAAETAAVPGLCEMSLRK